MSMFNYERRKSRSVKVGEITIGGEAEVQVQSMTNTNTLDTSGSVGQILRIADAGADLVRLTTQGIAEAANMEEIERGIREAGCRVPLSADVHFNPKAAYEAARHCEKVRINPGNFVDAARTFRKLTFTDEEYAAELDKIQEALDPFIAICKENKTAVRLGVNHGSLSDRIMSRYGDTPEGMVESVMEFLHAFRRRDFHDIVISMKASNVVVMTSTVRMLAERMESEGMDYPLHLGVTEAGDGEDGRVKSAVGIGMLLALGLGDTIRVSLSEPPEAEIPVAIALRDYISLRKDHPEIPEPTKISGYPSRNNAEGWFGNRSQNWPLVEGLDFKSSEEGLVAVDASSEPSQAMEFGKIILSSSHVNPVGEMASWIERYQEAGGKAPICLKVSYADNDADTVRLKASADLGALLLLGYGNAIAIGSPRLSGSDNQKLALGILQATRLRMSKTEYIACPSCGRTLFDLPKTLAEVRGATSHLKHLKIGVMGCIVNGPGEMADADYGYVGAGPGRVSLYKGKELRVKNIPTAEALPALISLIRENGDWVDA